MLMMQEVNYFRDALSMMCNVSGDSDAASPRCLTSLRKLLHVGLIDVVSSASEQIAFEFNVRIDLLDVTTTAMLNV
jgi:hypothetical protein